MVTRAKTKRPVDEILSDITAIAAERAEAEAEAKRLYQRQLDLMVEAREGTETPATFKVIAKAIADGGGKGTVVGVDAALRKVGDARGRKVA